MPRLFSFLAALSVGLILQTIVVLRLFEFLAIRKIPKFVEKKASEKEIRLYLKQKIVQEMELHRGLLLMVMFTTVAVIVALAFFYVPWHPISLIGKVIRWILYVPAAVYATVPLGFLFERLAPSKKRIGEALRASGYEPCISIARSWHREAMIDEFAKALRNNLVRQPGIQQLVMCMDPECSAEEQELLTAEAQRDLKKREQRGSGNLAEFIALLTDSRSKEIERALAIAGSVTPDKSLLSAVQDVIEAPREIHADKKVFDPELQQNGTIAWSEETYRRINVLARAPLEWLAKRERELERERIPEQIIVRCEKCHKKYVLLENAVVTTWERAAAQFQFGTGLGGASPDLIAPADSETISRKYATQVEEVARIKNSIRQRSWTCRECNSTYRYMER